MGLGAAKVKQRFGLDPRNTAWSNDTSKFGHTMLEKYGWKPGMGLGTLPHESARTHIRVSIKDDTLGLGAKTRRQGARDDLDADGCAGLDVFQRLLGRLNGKEEQVSQELERQRVHRVINGKWGVHFVKGEVLSSTWDPETRTLRQYSNTESRKRPAEEQGDTEEVKRHRKEKKEKKDKKKGKKDKTARKDKKISEDRVEKRDRRQKKDKKEKKDKTEKKAKKEKGEKKHKHKHGHGKDKLRRQPPALEASRLSARSRWIRQKKAATMDPQALNEIFMVTADSK